MESFFDLYVTSLLNVIKADWTTEVSHISWSNWTSLAVLVLLNITVVALAILYLWRFHRIDADTPYNALLDGTRLEEDDKTRWLLFYPALFFGRRISFTLSVLLFKNFLWGQIAIQFAFSTAMIIYLLHAWPLQTPFAVKMEVFNECTIVVLLYGLMCFTDFVPDPMVRYRIGWCYIVVALGNIFVHLCILAFGTGKVIKNKLKAWCCKSQKVDQRITNRSIQQMADDS